MTTDGKKPDGATTYATERLIFQAKDVVAGVTGNLLKAETKGQAVSLSLPVPHILIAGDQIGLKVNNKPAGLTYTLPRDYAVGETLQISLNGGDRPDNATSNVNYFLKRYTTGKETVGPSDQVFTTDYIGPAIENVFPQFPQTFTLDQLISDGKGRYCLDSAVPSYPNAEIGDTLALRVGSTVVATAAVQPGQATNLRVYQEDVLRYSGPQTVTIAASDAPGNSTVSQTHTPDFLLSLYGEDFTESENWWSAAEQDHRVNRLTFMAFDAKYAQIGAQYDPANSASRKNSLRIYQLQGEAGKLCLRIKTDFLWQSVVFRAFSNDAKQKGLTGWKRAYRGALKVEDSQFSLGYHDINNHYWSPTNAPCDRLELHAYAVNGSPNESPEFWVRNLMFEGCTVV